jgi:hypothetical protein
VICTWSTQVRFQIGWKIALAKRRAEDVLHGVLAEVVVDAEDLGLVEAGVYPLVELAGGRLVAPVRLLDTTRKSHRVGRGSARRRPARPPRR